MNRLIWIALAAAGALLTAAAQADSPAPAYVYPPVAPSQKFEGYPTNLDSKPSATPNQVEEMTFKTEDPKPRVALVVRRGSLRNSGLPLGAAVHVAYEFVHPDWVTVDLSVIKRGVLPEKSDLLFRDADRPELGVKSSTTRRSDGQIVDRVELELQHFIWEGMRDQAEFSGISFDYGYRVIAGRTQMKTERTSPVLFKVIRSGHRGITWRYGALDLMPVRSSPLARPVQALGALLVLFALVYLAIRGVQELWPGRWYTAIGLAVATLRAIQIEYRDGFVLNRDQCAELSRTLRNALSSPGLTGAEVAQRFAHHKKGRQIVAVLALLDAVAAEEGRVLRGAQADELLDNIAAILGDK